MRNAKINEEVYDSIREVISNLKYLKINTAAIDFGIKDISSLPVSTWQNPYVFSDGTYRSVNYLALFATLSFHYWTENTYWQRYVNGAELYGSYSLMYLLKEAIARGLEIYEPDVMMGVSFEDFRELLKGHSEVELPYLHERYNMMQEIGSVLKNRFDGNFVNLFQEAGYNTNKVNQLLVSNFNCFRDEVKYGEHKLKFYKKSQEVITLVFEQFNGKGLGAFTNIEDLTVSSDYKLPQMMNSLGYLEYSEDLAQQLNTRTIFQEYSREAVEIRAATIETGRLISEKLHELGEDLLPFEISNRLWTASQNPELETVEHPRIEGIWV